MNMIDSCENMIFVLYNLSDDKLLSIEDNENLVNIDKTVSSILNDLECMQDELRDLLNKVNDKREKELSND